MTSDRGFEIGDYPPPAYIPYTSGLNSQQPSVQDVDDSTNAPKIPDNKNGQPGIPRVMERHNPTAYMSPSVALPPPDAARRPPLHRANASNNIHIELTPDNGTPDDPPDTARQSWFSYQWGRNKDLCKILLVNTPFLVMFIMDIVGMAIMPTSAYYRKVLYQNTIWTCTNLTVCITTGFINLTWFFSSTTWGNEERFKREAIRYRSRQNIWVLLFLFRIMVCCVGVVVWPFISRRIHEDIVPTPPTCQEHGFSSSILLNVVPGKNGVFWGNSWLANNVTIESGTDVFGMNLSPSIPQVRNMDMFFLTPNEKQTSTELFPRVSGTLVALSLVKRTYEFHHAPSLLGTPVDEFASYQGGIRNGTFSDDTGHYLSFPSLGIRSASKTDWSHLNKRPDVVLADDWRVVLASAEKHPNDTPDITFRMCAPWTVKEMVENENVMEKVLVPLARVGVEMAIWGGENSLAVILKGLRDG